MTEEIRKQIAKINPSQKSMHFEISRSFLMICDKMDEMIDALYGGTKTQEAKPAQKKYNTTKEDKK